MDKSLLIKRLVECKDANKTLTEAYNLSISNANIEPSELFTRCTRFISELEELSWNFAQITIEAPKFKLNADDKFTRTDFRTLCDVVCEFLGDTIENLCMNPVFIQPSHLDGCPINTNELVMYTTKPFDVNSQSTVTFDKDQYKAIKCYPEKTQYYDIYLTVIDLI